MNGPAMVSTGRKAHRAPVRDGSSILPRSTDDWLVFEVSVVSSATPEQVHAEILRALGHVFYEVMVERS